MPELFNENLSTEYFKVVDIVTDFDKRLLTIKGWGVTLSLAALAWGFQNQHYGLFLIGAVSGLAFWAIEAAVKRHQMRYYVRMREIEVIAYDLDKVALSDGTYASSPLIDWSWTNAPDFFKGASSGLPDKPEPYGKFVSYWLTSIGIHVSFPHVITILVGSTLFVLGRIGVFEMPL